MTKTTISGKASCPHCRAFSCTCRLSALQKTGNASGKTGCTCIPAACPSCGRPVNVTLPLNPGAKNHGESRS